MFFLQTGPNEAARQVEQNKARLHDPRAAFETAFRFQHHDGGNRQRVVDTEVEEPNGYAVLTAFTMAQADSCELIRDIIGNPFLPVAINPSVLAWNDGVVDRLAQTAYEERHLPTGTLDNGLLAILADALEEAGCTDADILGHLRGPGLHVRGCWPVDLCLGKS
jgi:hypothetical protein